MLPLGSVPQRLPNNAARLITAINGLARLNAVGIVPEPPDETAGYSEEYWRIYAQALKDVIRGVDRVPYRREEGA